MFFIDILAHLFSHKDFFRQKSSYCREHSAQSAHVGSYVLQGRRTRMSSKVAAGVAHAVVHWELDHPAQTRTDDRSRRRPVAGGVGVESCKECIGLRSPVSCMVS